MTESGEVRHVLGLDDGGEHGGEGGIPLAEVIGGIEPGDGLHVLVVPQCGGLMLPQDPVEQRCLYSGRSMSRMSLLASMRSPMNLPVDKMKADVPAFKSYVDDIVRLNQDDWRKQALEEFRKNGRKPVAFPVEAKQPEGSYFTQQADPNWFYAD
ncbi:hypothetical protein ABZ918_30640 [Streptomyces viridosporus]